MRKKKEKKIVNILNWIELSISDENDKKTLIYENWGSYEDNKGKK
jgi:hypothetical protein